MTGVSLSRQSPFLALCRDHGPCRNIELVLLQEARAGAIEEFCLDREFSIATGVLVFFCRDRLFKAFCRDRDFMSQQGLPGPMSR